MSDPFQRTFNIFWVEAELQIAAAMKELAEEKGVHDGDRSGRGRGNPNDNQSAEDEPQTYTG
jgi:hypothetical protein